MKITVHAINDRKYIIPTGRMHRSDWFHCDHCGRTVMVYTGGDKYPCSECGHTMFRK